MAALEPVVGYSDLCCSRCKRWKELAHGGLPKVTACVATAGYMVVQPVTGDTFASMHGGGRKYLFDLGTGKYSSGSLPWFEAIYGRRGIAFDEVFGAHRN